MAKEKSSETKVKVGKAYAIYVSALGRLFDMVGGSLKFKLAIKRMKEEMQTKVFVETAAVRDASEVLKVAITKKNQEAQAKGVQPIDTPEVIEARKTMDSVCAVADEKEITLIASKIPLSLVPDETILARQFSFQEADPETGNPKYVQGDYTTLVAAIYDDLIDETA
jgi:hypothetical protein